MMLESGLVRGVLSGVLARGVVTSVRGIFGCLVVGVMRGVVNNFLGMVLVLGVVVFGFGLHGVVGGVVVVVVVVVVDDDDDDDFGGSNSDVMKSQCRLS
jgi:hypothetical protein